MNDEEWGPWQSHNGSGCPCVGQVVHVILGSDPDGVDPRECPDGDWHDLIEEIAPDEAVIVARNLGSWTGAEGWFPVIRYRIRKPRALLDLIERARELDDAPEGPRVIKHKETAK